MVQDYFYNMKNVNIKQTKIILDCMLLHLFNTSKFILFCLFQ